MEFVWIAIFAASISNLQKTFRIKYTRIHDWAALWQQAMLGNHGNVMNLLWQFNSRVANPVYYFLHSFCWNALLVFFVGGGAPWHCIGLPPFIIFIGYFCGSFQSANICSIRWSMEHNIVKHLVSASSKGFHAFSVFWKRWSEGRMEIRIWLTT